MVIPEKLRGKLLDDLHEGHVGVVKMKSLARSYVWWPKIDSDIESVAKNCTGCQVTRASPARVTHPTVWAMVANTHRLCRTCQRPDGYGRGRCLQ